MRWPMRYRARGVPVVMGGYHPTFLPDEALEHADAVVIGDAEGVWERLLEDFRAGRLQRRYAGATERTALGLSTGSLASTAASATRRSSSSSTGAAVASPATSARSTASTAPSLRVRPLDGLIAEIESLPDEAPAVLRGRQPVRRKGGAPRVARRARSR